MPSAFGIAGISILFTGAAGADDTTLPLYSSAEQGDVTHATVAVTFSENITSTGDDYTTGVTIKINAATQTINSGTRQVNQSIVYYVLAAQADANDTITWEYSDTLGTIQDTSGNQLGDVTAQTVTNNVGTHLVFDNIHDSIHAFTSLHL